MEKLFDGLITLENNEKYDELINSLDSKTATKIIEIAIMYAQSSGLFNMQESHCIYECIKKMLNKE